MSRLFAEVAELLVVSPVFNTGEAEHLGLAGSIPVHLRQVLVRRDRAILAAIAPRR